MSSCALEGGAFCTNMKDADFSENVDALQCDIDALARARLCDVRLLHPLPPLQPIAILGEHPRLPLPFRHPSSKRNSLRGSKGAFMWLRHRSSRSSDS
jgi:hypothetical protein